ncbi:tRNA 2'-phosphotransferase 1 isoform X2 [Carettochelys insculpta]|uniref:tRNA 2'-phosphotransferase 1 isoform X2 n=1 Tax=Carettochelys insculpta TaxID=44489 RepID=UPI003EB8DC4E
MTPASRAPPRPLGRIAHACPVAGCPLPPAARAAGPHRSWDTRLDGLPRRPALPGRLQHPEAFAAQEQALQATCLARDASCPADGWCTESRSRITTTSMDPEGPESQQPLSRALGRRGRKPGRQKRHQDQNPDVHLSKALSYVLRHGAAQLGLEMGADGFVDVASLLSLPRFRGVSVADLQRVVETNEKRRFALRPHPTDGRLQIRANQGHSLQVAELDLTPLLEPTDLPQTMAHGTYLRHWPAICQGGLSRMGRNHIHLAPGLPGDGHVLSGMRKDCEVAIVINGPKALEDGILFYRSANGVILTPGDAEGLLPPQYFQKVLQLQPDRRLLPLT